MQFKAQTPHVDRPPTVSSHTWVIAIVELLRQQRCTLPLRQAATRPVATSREGTCISTTYSSILAISLSASTPPGSGSSSMKKSLDCQMLMAFSWSNRRRKAVCSLLMRCMHVDTAVTGKDICVAFLRVCSSSTRTLYADRGLRWHCYFIWRICHQSEIRPLRYWLKFMN